MKGKKSETTISVPGYNSQSWTEFARWTKATRLKVVAAPLFQSSITEDGPSANALLDGPRTVSLSFFGSIIIMEDISITIMGVMSMLAMPPSDQVATLSSYDFQVLNTAY